MLPIMLTVNSECSSVLFSLLFAVAAAPMAAQSHPEPPQKVTVCELLNHRKEWNHKLVQVTGFASHGFEDSGFTDPTCVGGDFGLWMEYGGKLRTGTMSTVSTWNRTSDRPMAVEGIKVPLADDAMFHRFDDFLHQAPSRVVHSTVLARFFAGTLQDTGSGKRWGGYGHLWCCSLLVIQRVVDVDDRLRPDLDYSNSPEQPDTYPHKDLWAASTPAQNLRDLHRAEYDSGEYAFTDRERVAREAIAPYAPAPRVNPESLVMTRKSGNAYRAVYMAAAQDSQRQFMIVVNRPYWLSYSAKDPNRVPWVVLAAYELEDKEDAR
jgi:hypothetical protein